MKSSVEEFKLYVSSGGLKVKFYGNKGDFAIAMDIWKTNTWLHVCVTHNRESGIIELFSDSRFLGNTSGNNWKGPAITRQSTLGILYQKQYLPAMFLYSGKFAGLNVWDFILNESQIKAVYELGFDGNIFSMNLEEGSVNVVLDEAGYVAIRNDLAEDVSTKSGTGGYKEMPKVAEPYLITFTFLNYYHLLLRTCQEQNTYHDCALKLQPII